MTIAHTAVRRRPTLTESYEGKHIFVTGVTGFLGKVWLAMVLDKFRGVRRITVAARGKKDTSAEERFTQIIECSPVFRPLREELGQGIRALIADKVQVVEAQVTEPLCGLSEEEAQRIMADVDVVVHFAGLTDFEPDPQMSIDANIHGASHAADLASMTKAQRYVHVSTAFVAGRSGHVVEESITRGISPNGTHFDPEAELEAIERSLASLDKKKDRIDFAMARAEELGWPNIYTYTKSLSEHLLEGRSDIASTTFRPAIVECATSYPFPGWNEGINTSGPLVWLLSTSFQRVPARPQNHFDVVPVDTVSRAMVLVVAAVLADESHAVYHCASSHENPLNFERAVDLTGLAIRRTHERSSKPFERRVLKHLEATCFDPDQPQVLGYKRMRDLARAAKKALQFEGDRLPKMYRRLGIPKYLVEEAAQGCRTVERQLGRVEMMLGQYKPFIEELNYCFVTANLMELSARLAAEDEPFAFDIADLCWRDYWLNVQVPGLEKWSIPLLRGEKVPEDEPLPRLDEEASDQPAARVNDRQSKPVQAAG